MYIVKYFFKIILRVFTAFFLLIGLALLIFNWPVTTENENMEFGTCFSPRAVEGMDYDWKEGFTAMLEELKPQKVRIASYWTEVEKTKGEYDFSETDWQIDEAEKYDTDIILAMGIKVPRWPECFIPEFYEEDKVEREKALLLYETELVERYKDRENIIIWQVENEPFLPFGHCTEGAIDGELVDKEIAHVRALDDSREIMTTDSGELSLWYQAAKRADIFGTTLYRIIYKEPYGYFKYPIGPAFFRVKGWFIGTFANQHDIVVSELQAEPWGPGWVMDLSIEEQYKSMNPKKLDEIAQYTRKTNFDAAYLWGVEWWYWLKTQQDKPEMWEAAKKIITQREATERKEDTEDAEKTEAIEGDEDAKIIEETE